MRQYAVILFDLDGTLTDPAPGITGSVQYSLNKLGIAADPAELLPFIGPPLHDSFRRFFHLSPGQVEQAVAGYREYYSERGIYENRVYPGIEEMLRKLCEQERTLALATSKPTFFAEKVLDHFRLSDYFTLVAGSNLDGTRTDKAEVIRYALQHLPSPVPQPVVMVGDREHDIIGARKCAVDSIAVMYGYGTADELKEAGPTCLAESVAALARLLGV